jgi:hypothetical protein
MLIVSLIVTSVMLLVLTGLAFTRAALPLIGIAGACLLMLSLPLCMISPVLSLPCLLLSLVSLGWLFTGRKPLVYLK